MVRQGVNAIIMLPVDSVAEAPAMEAPARPGVPVILADIPPAPGTKYAVSAWSQNQVEADAGALGLIKKGNILIVRGIAGNQNDVVLYNQKVADLKNCPNIHVAAELYGNWDNGTAKTVVSQYLAVAPAADRRASSGRRHVRRHRPGVPVARASRSPPIADGECHGGDLSWWLANKSKLQDGRRAASTASRARYTYFDVALRILANKGPKYNVLEMPAVTIDNANLAKFAKPGLPLTSNAEIGGPETAWCDDTCLNTYFNKVRVAAEIAIAALRNAE